MCTSEDGQVIWLFTSYSFIFNWFLPLYERITVPLTNSVHGKHVSDVVIGDSRLKRYNKRD